MLKSTTKIEEHQTTKRNELIHYNIRRQLTGLVIRRNREEHIQVGIRSVVRMVNHKAISRINVTFVVYLVCHED